MNKVDSSNCVLSATTTSLAHMASILGAITSVNTRAVVSIAEDGLNFITENSHVCRGEFIRIKQKELY
jgi:cell cycle checkpoint protein